MKVYLSGPMTGHVNYNIEAFDKAAAELRALGFTVVNPTELGNPVLKPNDEEYNWRQYLARDIGNLLSDVSIEALIALPGWQASKGSVLEIHVAQYLGLKVFPLAAVLAAGEKINIGEK